MTKDRNRNAAGEYIFDPAHKDDQAHSAFQTKEVTPGGNRPIAELGIDPVSLFEQALEQTRMAIALSDPHAPDNPLVFVNKAFEKLTGYGRREVIGKNCRFLQTDRTSRSELRRLRTALEEEETVVVELENQRKDGSVFINALHVGPIYGADGKLSHFYASQWNITELVEKRAESVQRGVVARELQHRIGNLFAVISSIVRLSGKDETNVDAALSKANERILALARAHTVTIKAQGAESDPADLGQLVDIVLKPYITNAKGRLLTGGTPLELVGDIVTPLGLVLHELATNAVKHGALKRAEGRITVEWYLEDGALKIIWDEDCGDRIEETRSGAGTGTRVLEGVLASIDATITYHWRERGVKVAISVPLPPPNHSTELVDA